MKYIFYTFCLILLSWTKNASGQEDTHTFYFDYRIEYAYTSPSVPNGQIIAYYNSLDKYVSYAYVSPYMEDGTQVIAFFDGSSIVFSEEPNQRKGVIYKATMPGRKTTDTAINDSGKRLNRKVLPTNTKVDIAGYEAVEYQGTLDDGSKRTLWISEESFDARTLHTPIMGSMNILPLPLTEAGFIGPEQFLLGSEIELEGGDRYSLTVTYLEYELQKITFEDFEIVKTDPENNMASNYSAFRSLLREKKYEVWQEYDKMGGLEYAPMTYDFDQKYTYVLTTSAGKMEMDVYFNSVFEFCGLRSTQFPNNLAFILGFKDGTVIAYYEDETSTESSEAVFFAPSGNGLHLDHPENINWSHYAFQNQWQSTDQTKNIAGLSSTGYRPVQQSNNGDQMFLHQMDVDPRSLYMDYADLITGFPPIFHAASNLPPNLLITLWQSKDSEGKDITLELQSAKTQILYQFSDKEIEKFNKVVRR